MMMNFKNTDEIREWIAEYYDEETADEVALYEDFDYASAFIGLSQNNIAVYDYELMLEYLIANYDFSIEQAVEWIDLNTFYVNFGKDTPIIVTPVIEY